VGLAAVLVATDLTSYSLGRPLVPDVMRDVYRTSWLPTLLFTLVVLAPLGEETLFRGFFYQGIATSRAGPVVAIIMSTVVFALMHGQYDWYGVIGIAAIGLYLGVVRYRTGSLFLTMVLHSVGNLVASLELIIQENWLK
jgi:membrane protease YdiL (CAAX protease family)